MKKNRKDGPVILQNRWRKIFMIMRLTFFMTVCLVYGLSANVLSQQKVSMDLGYATVKRVLNEFQRQTGNIVIYSSERLNTQHKVKADFDKVDIDVFLTSVLSDCGMSYKVMDDYILIVPEEAKEKGMPQVKELQIQGVVMDTDGHPLPGVSVIIKGTSIGVATDMTGKFAIRVADTKDLVLVFSFIGMERQEVSYKGQPSLKVVMKENTSEMDEVIVTGYQTIEKTRMTGSVEVMTAKDIANKGYTNVQDILKGQLAGVTTMSISGRPGAQAQIRIRGINSLTGDMEPMWIVDGMPLQGDVPSVSMGGTEFQETVLTSGIGNITPDDIESITVLKDAAATAIYGSRAANGVIVITTKRGTAGKSYINVQLSYGISEAPENRLKMMNTQQKIDFERGIYEDYPGMDLGGRVYQVLKKVDNGNLTQKEADAEIARLRQINTNWFDEIFRTASTQNHSISLSGGDERTQYYGSLSYLSQEGVMPNNKYQSVGGSIKLTHDFNKFLRVYFDLRSTLRNDRSSASPVNPLDYATYANTYERPYDENGNYDYDRSYNFSRSVIKDGYEYDFNILKDMNENTSKTRYLSNQINLKLEFKIIEGLMVSTMGTLSNSNSHTKRELIPSSYASKYYNWLNKYYSEGEVPDAMNNGRIDESTSRSEQWTIRNEIKFARGFQGKDHYINVYLGQEVSSSKGYGFSSMIPEWSPIYGVASYPDLTGWKINSSLSISSLGSHSETQDRSVSFFATGSYSYKDRYIFQGSARLDGVDIIGTQNRFSPLWNVSGKWNVHNEVFMQGVDFITQLALRCSYGFTGSIDRNALPFSRLGIDSGSNKYDGEKVMDRYYPSNPSIKWQRKEDRNIGFDLSLFNSRINLTVNYYNNDTRNLLDDKKIAFSTGRSSVSANVASVNNKGWEISLRTMNVRTDDFSWVTSFNFAQNKDKVTQTYYQDLSEYSVSTNSTFEDIYNLYIQGNPIKAYYGYQFAGVDPLTGATLAYVDGYDKNGNRLGSLNAEGKYVYNMDYDLTVELANASRGYLGRSYPPITGGFGTQFNYKRFSLSAQFSYMAGHLARSFQYYSKGGTVSASAKNLLAVEANRWRKPGDITNIPKYGTDRTEYLYQLFDFRFEKGNFVKCNNISFGYNLESKWCEKMHLSRARFNFNVSNVFTLTKYRVIDPETMGAFTYPSARTYNFSISVGI